MSPRNVDVLHTTTQIYRRIPGYAIRVCKQISPCGCQMLSGRLARGTQERVPPFTLIPEPSSFLDSFLIGYDGLAPVKRSAFVQGMRRYSDDEFGMRSLRRDQTRNVPHSRHTFAINKNVHIQVASPYIDIFK